MNTNNKRKTLIFGHRGASSDAPENTLKAFNKAIELEAEYIEFDAHQSKDGEIVIIHDGNTLRTTGHFGFIKKMTLAELKELDFGEGEKILTLQELIDFLKAAGTLKSEFSKLKSLGQHRLVFGIKEWKNVDQKPSFNYSATSLPYPYNDKNLYVNASNNLWYRTMWSYFPEFSEIYYRELLSIIKNFEGSTYFFNKGIVYGNLGVSQASQMKLDEGFANILKALIEDSPYSQTPAQARLFVVFSKPSPPNDINCR